MLQSGRMWDLLITWGGLIIMWLFPISLMRNSDISWPILATRLKIAVTQLHRFWFYDYPGIPFEWNRGQSVVDAANGSASCLKWNTLNPQRGVGSRGNEHPREAHACLSVIKSLRNEGWLVDGFILFWLVEQMHVNSCSKWQKKKEIEVFMFFQNFTMLWWNHAAAKRWWWWYVQVIRVILQQRARTCCGGGKGNLLWRGKHYLW